jgi:hypothetical protein
VLLCILSTLSGFAQTHEFKLADAAGGTPEGMFLSITPPSEWLKSSKGNQIVWDRRTPNNARITCEIKEYSAGEIQSLKVETKGTTGMGEDIFTDDQTGVETGTITWRSVKIWPNYNYMDVVVYIYGAPTIFSFSLNFEYDEATGPAIEQEIKSILSGIKIRGKYVPETKLTLESFLYAFSVIEGQDTLYGYKNRDNVVVIPPQFYSADPLYEGLAKVSVRTRNIYSESGWEERYGFINALAEWAIAPDYEDATWFRNGTAGVKLNGKWGFIDKIGNVVIAPEYDEVGAFVNGLAKVNKGVNPTLDWNDPASRGKWGFIDPSGTVVIPLQYLNATDFAENGKAEVQLEINRYFYIDKQGKRVE